MPSELRVAILTHGIDRFERKGYVLSALVSRWESRGLTAVVSKGTAQPPPPADLAISHIDITRVDEAYRRRFEAYPLVINGRVLDISKSRVSNQIIDRDDPHQGKVIVKTQSNFGGMRELQARYRDGDTRESLDVQRPWRKTRTLAEYPIFDTPADVPLGIWRNPELVVEKFRPERNDQGEYVLRSWVFLGDRGVYYECISDDAVVKGKNTKRRVVIDDAEIPESLRVKREQLGFDYGKFDFGIVDGEAVLYDANRTPGLPPQGTESYKVTDQYPRLSEGLDYFLKKMGRSGLYG